jgi:hypothetical protein
MQSPAIAVELTANRKVGAVSVTMASQASCPSDCPLLHSGCYAESGPQGISTARLNRSKVKDSVAIAKAEVKAINQLSGTRPLRLHVVGDCSTTAAAKTLADGIEAIGYGPEVWTYTHAWRTVARSAWGTKVSVLASCESTTDVKKAARKGYATAIVVDQFQPAANGVANGKAYQLDGVRIVPCPQQTGKASDCTSCRLCWHDDRLKAAGVTIGFEAHGSGVKRVKQAIELIQIGKG